MKPGRIETILFLQKAEVLPAQRDLVVEAIGRALPDARVIACGHVEEVPLGGRFDAVIAPTLPWLPELHKGPRADAKVIDALRGQVAVLGQVDAQAVGQLIDRQRARYQQ